MLTFLRRIRKSMIDNGSTRKYILYAIGEIALVVIGILIALQINNWNEWRRDRVKERKVLEQLVRTIDRNSDHFTDLTDRMKRNNDRTEVILSIIENKDLYEESMNKLFHSARVGQRLRIVSAGYEELKNTGFDNIQSDSLKEGIINLFETTYSETEKVFSEITLYDIHLRKFLIDNFLEIGSNKLMPVNYDFIINNHFYYSSLLRIRSMRKWRIDLIDKSLKENQKVLRLIKDKLSEME